MGVLLAVASLAIGSVAHAQPAPPASADVVVAAAPGSPTGITLIGRTATTLRLRWTPPAADGGSAITDYVVETAVAGTTTWVTANDGVSDAPAATVRDLAAGTAYQVRVSAVNADGTGAPAVAGFPGGKVAAGQYQTCVLQADGTVRCWGDVAATGSYGQLGDNLTVFEPYVASTVTGLSGVASLGVGARHVCALRTNGTLWCWGEGTNGRLGTGTALHRQAPADTGLTGVGEVALGGTFTCARVGSRVSCFGGAANGRLGNGTTTPDVATSGTSFVKLNATTELDDATAIAIGISHTCAIRSSGGVVCWGAGANGKIGNNAASDQTYAVAVQGLPADDAPVQLALGSEHSCARLTSGAVYCWGRNAEYQLGDGTNSQRNTAVRSVSSLAGIEEISATAATTCARLADGGVRCWGAGTGNEIGDGGAATRTTPQAVSGISTATSLRGSGWNITCAGLADGGTRCWGQGTYGRRGDGIATAVATPVDVREIMVTASLPDAPTNPLARQTGATSVRFSWAPAHPRGATVTDYLVQWSSDGATWTTYQDGTSKTPIANLTGLPTGTPLVFRVAAVNANGTSLWAATGSMRPVANAMAGGDEHLCAATTLGQLACWGRNPNGQFGNGTTADAYEPITIDPGASARAVSAGIGFTCVLSATGTVRCAGVGTTGQLGDGLSTSSTTFVDVTGISGATLIRSGALHTCAILADQTLSCWGRGAEGQLGGSLTTAPTPRAVASLTGVTGLALAGNTTCAIVAGGEVRCWGAGGEGQLGNGTTTATQATPVAVEASAGVNLTGITAISGRDRSFCAVRGSDGTVWCWGRNGESQAGDSTATTPRSRPVQTWNVTGAVNVAMGYRNGCAVLATGAVRCWGTQSRGENGDNSATTRTTAVPVIGIASAVDIVAARQTMCVRLQTRGLRCWGLADQGQVGDGQARTAAVTLPTTVRALTPPTGTPTRPGSPSGVTLASRTASTIDITWTAPDLDGGSPVTDYVVEYTIAGFDSWTTFPDGVSTDRRATITGLRPASEYNVRVSAVNAQGWSEPRTMQQQASRVALTDNAGCALLVTGSVTCWGHNGNGQLGNGAVLNAATARSTVVPTLSGVTQLVGGANHYCALLGDAQRRVRCWGLNTNGQIGIGSTTSPQSSTQLVSGLTDVVQLAAGNAHVCARKADGTVWCWGAGASGQLGNGTTTASQTTPVAVTGIATAVGIAAGGVTSCAVLADGGVRCWGSNANGMLGDLTTTNRTTPVAVSGVSTATVVGVGANHACALLADTTVVCWGLGASGQLGDGTQISRALRATMLGIDGATGLFLGNNHTCVLVTGGLIRCAGVGTNGELGDGANTTRGFAATLPVDVSFSSLSGGRGGTCGAIDGSTPMCWGVNGNYRLGDATNVARWMPANVVKTVPMPNRPDPPINLTASWRDASTIDLAWGADSARGATITDYRIEYTTDGGASWTVHPDGVSTSTSATLTGMPGGTYVLRVTTLSTNGASLPASTAPATSLALGDGHGCAVGAAGDIACWGAGANGRLGTSTLDNRPVATWIDRTDRVTQADAEYLATCARTTSGGVKCWGQGTTGQLGIGNGTAIDSPEAQTVPGISTATQVATGRAHACALLVGGTVRCWGTGTNGQLGDGSTSSALRLQPVTAAGISGATQIAAGEAFTCALLADQTVRCWGLQTNGRLGNNVTTGNALTSTVVLRAAGTSLTEVVEITAYYQTACARRSDGTVWCWGTNTNGQVGDGTKVASALAKQTPIVGATAVRVGDQSACAIVAGGAIRCWGLGTSGQLGDGSTTSSLTPVAVSGITGATALGVGSSFACAVLADGAARCWGANGSTSRLGDGTTTSLRTSPVAVKGVGATLSATGVPSAPLGLVQASADGTSVTLNWSAPAYDGGSAITDYVIDYAELGSGVWRRFADGASTATAATVTGLMPGVAHAFRVAAVNAVGTGPLATMALSDVAAITRGANSGHACAVRSDGSVWCWGKNDAGQLGTGASSSQATAYPVRVAGLAGSATAVATGIGHTCALLANGAVQCWGRGSEGQLGHGSTSASLVPVAATGIGTATAIAVGDHHSCALLATGGVRCWGYNNVGQLGLGTTASATAPTEVPALTGASAISAGGSTTCALLGGGAARCWGANGSGQVGAGNVVSPVTSPTAVSVVSGIRAIQPTTSSTCAILSDSTVSCWGSNDSSQLGDGTTTARTTTAAPVQGLDNVRQIALATGSGCALIADATVRCWGLGTSGQIGDDVSTTRAFATQALGVTGATAVAMVDQAACALAGGRVSCWGLASSGQTGTASPSNAAVPTAVLPAPATGTRDVPQRVTGIAVASQTGTAALLQWDPASGNGSPITGYEVAYSSDRGATWTVVPTGSSTTPSVEVTGLVANQRYAFRVRGRSAVGLGRPGYLDGATQVSVGQTSACALLHSRALQCWGGNAYGQLADGTATNATVPTAAWGLEGVLATAAGRQFTCALLTGGTVKCWGYGPLGQLGDGTFGYSRSPRTVDLPGAASELASGQGDHMCAILQADGSIWCWGRNLHGALGDGISAHRATPVRAATITGAVSVAVGGLHTCAVLSTGAVNCWGLGTSGQLGNGTTTTSGTPVAVTGIANAVEVTAGATFSCALLADQSVSCWGAHDQGQLGAGGVANPQSVPVAVSSLTGATAIVAGDTHACAVIAGGEIRCWGRGAEGQLGNGGTAASTTPVAPQGSLTGVVGIGAGSASTCAVLSTGPVRCWGANSAGTVGDGTTSTRTSPTPVADIDTAFTTSVTAPGAVRGVAVSGRSGSSVSLQWTAPLRDGGSAITDYAIEHSTDGVAWTPFADGTSAVTATTVTGLQASAGYLFRVSAVNANGTGASEMVALGGTQVSAGAQHACAMSATGAVNCWGLGTSGQLGDGAGASSSLPRRVADVSGAIGISAGGDFTCAVLASGRISCWGGNAAGQLGNGVAGNRVTPAEVTGIANGRQVAAGSAMACARLGDGTVRCWGQGVNGQLGNGATGSSLIPVEVSGLAGVSAIAAGDDFACAVRSPGQVWCWGLNSSGQLGNGTTTSSSVPVRAGTISNAIGITAGAASACAILADRSVSCWGANGSYQLADGTTTARTTPVSVGSLDQIAGVSIGSNFVCATFVSTSGTCWGANAAGQLGTNDTTTRTGPSVIYGDARFTQIDTGTQFACGVNTDAAIRCWGEGANGKLGDGSSANRSRVGSVALVTRTPTVPGAPTGLVATAGNQQVRLSWTAPTSDGDSPLSGYRAYVVADPTRNCTTQIGLSASPTSCTVTGLANGADAVFAVVAINALGASTGSATATARPSADSPTGTDDVVSAIEAGGVLNGTPGANPVGSALANDLTPDLTVGGLGTSVTAIRTGAVRGAGTAGFVGEPLAGSYGSLTINATGDFSYAVDNESAAVEALTGGQQVRDYFNYTVTYATSTDTGIIEVVVTGANDAPRLGDDAATAREAGGAANGTAGLDVEGDVFDNDADPDAGSTLSVASVRRGGVTGSGTAGSVGSAFAGQYGTLTLRGNGTYAYVVDNSSAAVEALGAGQSLTESYNYTATDGLTSRSAVLAITIQGAADAPTLTATGVAAYTEQGAPRFLNPTLAISDVDSAALASATVAITADDVTGDELLFTADPGTMGNIAGSWNAATRVLSLSSAGATATLAQWRSALLAVRFQNALSDTPGRSRTISWQVSDGTASSAVATTSIAVTPVNDAPSMADVPVAGTEGEIVPFDQSNFASRFTDPEGTALATIAIASLPSAGQLLLGGVPVAAGDVLAVDAIDNLYFVPPAQSSTQRTFTFTASDGDKASGVATVRISFTGIDDPPTTSDAAVSTLIGYPAALGVDAFGAYGDPEGAALAGVQVVTLPDRGTLEFRANDGTWGPATAGQAVSAAQLDAGRLRFAAAAGQSGNPYATFTFRVYDGTQYSRFPNAMTVTVTTVNRAPTVAVPAAQTTAEDVPLAFSASAGNAIAVDDPDSSSLSVVASVPAGRGALTVATVASAYVGGNATESVRLTGPPSEVNIALGTLRYVPTPNASGAAYGVVTVTVDDRYATTSGTVDVTVTAIDDAPTLTQVATLTGATEDQPLTIPYADLLAASNAVDPEGAAIAFRVEAVTSGSLAKGGSAVVAGTTTVSVGESLTWTPAANAAGTIQAFTVVASDGSAASSTPVPVRVAVAAVDDRPTSTDDAVAVDEDASAVLGLDDFGAYADPEGAPLASVRIVQLPGVGALEVLTGSTWTPVAAGDVITAATIDAGRLRFSPVANASGSPYATLRFAVGDGSLLSLADYALAITVRPVADPAVLGAQTGGTTTDTSAFDAFSAVTGTLAATSPDGPTTFRYGVAGDTSGTQVVTVAGSYGSLALTSSTGAWTYTPSREAINRLASNATEVFRVTATAASGGGTTTTTLSLPITAVAEAITVRPTALTKGYGDPDPTLTYQVTSGSLVGDDAFTGSMTRVAGEAVGSYQITRGTLTISSAYDVTFVPRNLTITRRPLTVTVQSRTITYGDADPTPAWAVTSGSLLEGDAITGGPGRQSGSTVGAYAYTAGTLTAGSNYDLTVAGTLTISRRPVTVTGASVVTRDTDGTRVAQITGAALSGEVAGDDVQLANATTGTFAQATAGAAIPVATAMTLTGAKAGNYTLTQPTLTGEITLSGRIGRTISITSTQAGAYAFDAAPPTITAAPSDPGGTVSFASTTPSACTVDAASGAVAFVAAGSCSITASVDATSTHEGATSSPTTFAVTAVAPGAPTITGVTGRSEQLFVAFAQGAGGGSQAANVEYSVNGGTWVTPSPAATASPLVISGLVNGTTYAVRLRVVSAGGTSQPSAAANGAPIARTIAITAAVAAAYEYDDPPPVITATPSEAGGSIVYATAAPTVCLVDDDSGAVSFLRTGTCAVTATVTQAGALNAATSAPEVFAVTPVAPSAPTITGVTAGNGKLTVGFTQGDNGGADPTNVEYSVNGANWTARSPLSVDSPLVIAGLANGTAYPVRIRIVGPGGTSPASNQVSGTPTGTRTLSITSSVASSYLFTAQSPTIVATPSEPGGAITYSTSSSACSIGATSGKVTFLSGGTCSITASIAASGGLNAATATRSFTITAVAPAAPAITSIEPANGGLSVAFALGSSGGSAITGIRYSTNDGVDWSAPVAATSPLEITGLQNGTAYQVRLRAVNAIGDGTASASTEGTPVSSISRTVTITTALAASYLYSEAPPAIAATVDNPGGAISYASSTTGVCTVDATSGAVAFVAAGTCTLTASVAQSGIRAAATSNPVSFAVTAVAPTAPAITAIAPGDTQLAVSFAFGSNGGLAPTAVQYSIDGGTNWVSAGSTSSPVTITGLSNGTTYDVILQVVTGAGTSPTSNVASGTPTAPVVRTIEITTTVESSYPFTATPPTLEAAPSEPGGAVTFASSTTGVCTVGAATGIVAFVAPGSCSITASVAASGNLLGATSSAVSFAVVAAVPLAPTITSIVPGSTELSVQFAQGGSGGSATTNVQYSTDNGQSWTARSPASTASPLVITGLVNGTTYQVRLRLVNGVGSGAASTAVNGTPLSPNERSLAFGAAPNASYGFDDAPPTLVAAPSRGAGTVTYASTTPEVCLIESSSGAVSFVGLGACTVSASITADGLLDAVSTAPVSFQVVASAPGAPTITGITVGDGELSVAFTQGSTGGAAPTNVEYSTDGGQSWTARSPLSTSSPLVVGGLTGGTQYSVRIRLLGPGGTGAQSAVSLATPYGPPGAPTGVTATASNEAARVQWSAPSSNGGSAITTYVVTASPGGATCVWSSGPLECTLVTLENGTAYTFTVRAGNAAGLGVASAASAPVTPSAPAPPIEPTPPPIDPTPPAADEPAPPITAGPVQVPGDPPAIRDDGSARIPVSCEATTSCETTIAFVVGNQTIASSTRDVPGGGSANLALSLPRAVQERIAERGTLRVTIVVIVETDEGPVRSEQQLVLTAPPADAASGWTFIPASNGDQVVSAECEGPVVSRCEATIELYSDSATRARTLVGRAEVAGPAGGTMTGTVPLNGAGRRLLARQGFLRVDRVIKMVGTKVDGKVTVAGGASARLTVVSDRDWLLRALRVLAAGASARATLNGIIDAEGRNAISTSRAVELTRTDVIAVRERTLERVRALPMPSRRLRPIRARMERVIAHSLATDRAFLRAFATGDAGRWETAWRMSLEATAAKDAMVAAMQQQGVRLRIDVPPQTWRWP